MKPSLLLLIGSALLFTLLLSSCGDCSKKVDCPAYDDTLLTAFFPYADNQQIIYKTINSEQQIFTLKNTETSEAYQARSGLYGGIPVCTAHKTYQSNERDSSNGPSFSLNLQTQAEQRSALFTINRSIIQFNVRDTGFSQIDINYNFARQEKLANLTLGSRSFNNVTKAVRDTINIKSTGIYAIYYTRQEGLIGYSVYPSLKTWVKQ